MKEYTEFDTSGGQDRAVGWSTSTGLRPLQLQTFGRFILAGLMEGRRL